MRLRTALFFAILDFLHTTAIRLKVMLLNMLINNSVYTRSFYTLFSKATELFSKMYFKIGVIWVNISDNCDKCKFRGPHFCP